jgi:hypothetical protein
MSEQKILKAAQYRSELFGTEMHVERYSEEPEGAIQIRIEIDDVSVPVAMEDIDLLIACLEAVK